MALDNPNYFSVSGTPTKFSLFKRRTRNTNDANAPNISLSLPANSKLSSPSKQNVKTTSPGRKHSAGERHHRSFRSLLRSVSSSESAAAFFSGEPRPSDMAPESLSRQRFRERKSSLQSPSDDDVFLSEEAHCEQNNYYNLQINTLPSSSASHAGRRRHSIGTFMKDRSKNSPVTTVFNDVPKMQAPRVPKVPQASNKRIPTSSVNSFQQNIENLAPELDFKLRKLKDRASRVMEDVLLISSRQSEAAGVWVEYLNTCFHQVIHKTPPVKILSLCVEDLSPTISSDLSRRIESAHLVIPIICPSFLELILQTPAVGNSIRGLMFHLNPQKVVTMLLGVTEDLVTEHHKSILTSYDQWKRLSVRDQDQTFVHDFLGAAMIVYSLSQETPSSSFKNSSCGKALFTVFPKKVKPGQSRIIAVLNDPLNAEDTVTVTVDKSGEILNVNHVKRRNPYTLQFNIPDSCLEVSMLANIRVEKNGVPLGHRPIKCESRLRELDQILRSQEHPLEFMCQTLGFSSMDKEQLDGWMVMSFQRNLPPNFHLLAGVHPPVSGPRQNIPEEYPTLLHFAARFGLERLSWQLLECPGGEIACETKNAHGQCPADIAEHHGHQKLAGVLKGYMQMNELTSMYTYLKGMSDESTKNKDVRRLPNTTNEPEYIRPRPISETYMVPPSARPFTPEGESSYLEMSPSNHEFKTDEFSIKCSHVLEQANDLMNDSETDTDFTPRKVSVDEYIPSNGNQMGDYLLQPSNIKVNTKRSNLVQGDYLTQPSNICVNSYGDYLTHPSNKKVPQEKFNRQLSLNDNCPPVKVVLDQKSKSHSALNSSKLNLKKSREQLNTEDELLEIINDFKNNVFTIAEVEQLVANWKNRNDVQQSFKDKQEQLAKMREEYERIQQNMKESMKRPTPFDRVKKIFSRGKSKTVEVKLEGPSAAVQEDVKPNSIRPISSLSLHSVSSSSSSGRMSTGSVCSGASLGDSGTHSDNEDRKMLLNHIHSEAYSKRSRPGFDNYLVPPSPRPLNLNVFSSTTKLEERPPLPIPRPDEDSAYYIHFPPSGLPVNSPKASPMTPTSPNSADYLTVCDYMNIHSPCGLRTIQEQETYSPVDDSNINSTPSNSSDSNQTDNDDNTDYNVREYMNVSYK